MVSASCVACMEVLGWAAVPGQGQLGLVPVGLTALVGPKAELTMCVTISHLQTATTHSEWRSSGQAGSLPAQAEEQVGAAGVLQQQMQHDTRRQCGQAG